VTPFPNTAHQHAATQLVIILGNHVRQQKLGQVFMAGLKVVLDEPSGVGPDVVYISNARLDGLRSDGYYGAPDLIIEVLSTKPALDQLVKRQKYAQAGVPSYWIVDPDQKRLLAYRLDGDRYQLATQPEGEAIFEPDLFPALEIPLANLWL
jgi:Uma2 family endonuclease